jgi:hypothetical protein
MAKVQTMGYQQPVKIIEQKDLLPADDDLNIDRLMCFYAKLQGSKPISKRSLLWDRDGKADSLFWIAPTIKPLEVARWQSLKELYFATLYAIPQKKLR